MLWFFYVLSLTTTPHPLPGIWRPTQYHLTQGWKSLRPSMEDDCKHICIIRRTIWTLTLWKKSHVFFCFFFNVENCMTVGKIGFVPDPPLHHSSYFPHLYLALSSIPGTLLPSVPPRFLAVALLAVSPICFHSLGQDSLLCSSDTFSHRAAQCN